MKYIILDISKHFGFSNRYSTVQRVSEHIWETSLNYSAGYEMKIDDLQDELQQAREYISRESGLTIPDLAKYEDDIINVVRRSISDAYSSSYESEWMDRWWSELCEIIYDTYTLGTINLWDGKRAIPMSNKWMDRWETTDIGDIAIKVTRQQMIDYLLSECGDYHNSRSELRAMSWDELASCTHDALCDMTTVEVDIENIDRYGSLGDMSEWFTYFKEYEEITYQIKQSVAKHADRVKAYVRFKVPLCSRVTSI